MKVEWRLRELLEREGIKVATLAAQMAAVSPGSAPPSKRPALYNITSLDPEQRPERVTFQLLAEIGAALRVLTGRRVEVGELLEFRET